MQHSSTRLNRYRLITQAKLCWLALVLCVGGQKVRADMVSEVDVLAPAKQEVLLLITGAIKYTNQGDHSAHLDAEHLQHLPQHTIHTSTVATDGVKRFDGVLVRHVLDLVGAHGTYLEAQAHNGYTVHIPMDDFFDYEVLMATHMDGKQLELSDKGPLWIVYPRDSHRKLQDIRYDYRWVWQLKQLTVK
ncbi:molybdopterin-dependent oxidoreductase [Alcaligenes endophyticus]|uniref:Molybdopterin-dependent oxidoreductase n=1 Tax=Alcaligenes endophyticus TaxID=1929088 RepID=A0ABT8EJT0_9BURK|nr:molybdopterin-dependent oxidoreductase [Alcaligenes endophyticus]MCX5591852.1 molybdopterin-dependent oxidoreductase [Alcaligenes endophyticus]MDN4121542.1 molybdopterin-dependent oxidoreductase [Alcaligenes endophyticus]